MKYNIGDTFLAKCIKEFPEDDYLTYPSIFFIIYSMIYHIKIKMEKFGLMFQMIFLVELVLVSQKKNLMSILEN